jgi:peroxiredoxin
MTTIPTPWLGGLLCIVLAAGCRDDSPPLTQTPKNTGAKGNASGPEQPIAPKREPKSLRVPASEPPVEASAGRESVTATATGEFVTELTLPKVVLSEAHAKICRIKVGQNLPPIVLADTEGKPAPLEAQLGAKFTVVAFVRLQDPYAHELLDDLDRFIAPVFESKGVKVVAVAVAQPPAAVAEATKKLKVRLPIFSDAEGQVLEQLTTDKNHRGPWTYLVDPAGRVLWFDAEYSRSTRRDLQVALQVLTR